MIHPTSDAVRVPDHLRMRFLPALFRADLLIAENMIYRLAQRHIAGYTGGHWHFWLLSGNSGWIAPDMEKVTFCNPYNWFEEEISADAAGIILTSLVMNRRHWHHHEAGNLAMCQLMGMRAGALERVIEQHAEAGLIRRALD